MEMKKVAEEWEILNYDKEVVKSKEKTKKLVLEHFYKYIHVFGKKQSERMPTRKLQDHTIETKKGFVPRKGKVYLLSKRERERRGAQVHIKTIEEGLHQTLRVVSNSTCIFCREEEW